MKTNKRNQKKSKVICMIPPGVDSIIHPWGAISLGKYLDTRKLDTDFRLWDCRDDHFLTEINQKYGKDICRVFYMLKVEDVNTLFGVSKTPYSLLCLLAATGEDIFEYAAYNRKLDRKTAQALVRLKEEVQAYYLARCEELLKAEKTEFCLWALSVYDYTLLNALFLAQLIRRIDSESPIVLGGDYFTFESAEETIKAIDYIDGIAVGYGEDILKEIIQVQQNRQPVSSCRIQGFVNRSTPGGAGDDAELKTVNIPGFYPDLAKTLPFPYISLTANNEIRVLAQRGCSWGRCTFCMQLDKHRLYRMSAGELLEQFKAVLEGLIKDNEVPVPLKIYFDADENDYQLFCLFTDYLSSLANADYQFDISLWLQVKAFCPELAEKIVKIDNRRIRINFLLNFESLSVGTLKNMRKGHLPLNALEAAKIIQDCGQTITSNYFMRFPLETLESVHEEVEILGRIVHLLRPPEGRMMMLPYCPSNRDDIYRNQDKYNVTIHRHKTDVWLKKVFGLDLPYSIWAHTYNEKPAFNLERLIVYTYCKVINNMGTTLLPRNIAHINWNTGKGGVRERFGYMGRMFQFMFWFSIHSILQIFTRHKPFNRRITLLMYLFNLWQAGNFQNEYDYKVDQNSKNSRYKASYFAIKEGELVKDYHAPYFKQKFKMELAPDELKVLRAFYWHKKETDATAALGDKIDSRRIREIITRHLALGTLIRHRNSILCVANDPGYWKSNLKS